MARSRSRSKKTNRSRSRSRRRNVETQNSWKEFLSKMKGKGYSMKELSAMYYNIQNDFEIDPRLKYLTYNVFRASTAKEILASGYLRPGLMPEIFGFSDNSDDFVILRTMCDNRLTSHPGGDGIILCFDPKILIHYNDYGLWKKDDPYNKKIYKKEDFGKWFNEIYTTLKVTGKIGQGYCDEGRVSIKGKISLDKYLVKIIIPSYTSWNLDWYKPIPVEEYIPKKYLKLVESRDYIGEIYNWVDKDILQQMEENLVYEPKLNYLIYGVNDFYPGNYPNEIENILKTGNIVPYSKYGNNSISLIPECKYSEYIIPFVYKITIYLDAKILEDRDDYFFKYKGKVYPREKFDEWMDKTYIKPTILLTGEEVGGSCYDGTVKFTNPLPIDKYLIKISFPSRDDWEYITESSGYTFEDINKIVPRKYHKFIEIRERQKY